MAAERLPAAALAAIGLALLLAASGLAWWMQAALRPRHLAAGSADLPPGELSATLLLGGFRGLACDVLWMRATTARRERRTYESVALSTAISRLQPRFLRAWEYLAWDQAYNLAADEEDPAAKLAWMAAGVRSNVDGIVRNPAEERLVRHLAWMVMHRVDHTPGAADRDWRPEIAPVFAACLPLLGSSASDPALAAPALPEPPYRMAARLYRLSAALAAATGRQQVGMVQRMIPLALEREGDRLRNLGRHREALAQWIDALRAWEPVARALPPPGHERWDVERDAYDRNEGRLRRKAAAMAQALAGDRAAAEAVAAAILARDHGAIAAGVPALRERVARPAIRWLDE